MRFMTSDRRGHLRHKRGAQARPRVEALEPRCLLSGIVQVSVNDPFLGCNPDWPYHNTEAEPQLSVDPTNPKHLVGVWNQSDLGIAAGVSFDGGNKWQEVAIPGISACSGGTYPHNDDPWVSFAPNGVLYASSLGTNADGETKAVYVSRSTDGGLTWGAPATLAVGTSDGNDKESVTADPANPQLAYATWTRFSGQNGTTMFSRTTDGGQTWEPARKIADSGSNNANQGHQIVVLPDGTLVDVFCQIVINNGGGGTAHANFNLAVIRSTDKGQTWLPAKAPIHAAEMVPLIDTFTVPGARGVPNPDGGTGIRALMFIPDVTVDPVSGNLYAVWQDARFSDHQYTDVAFAMSKDGGFTWSAPIRVNQTPVNVPAGDRQALIPSVAVAADGTVAVSYYDFRNNTPAPGLLTDYWMVRADPHTDLTNPANWTAETRLTKSSFDMEKALVAGADGYFVGEYMGLSAAGNDFAALWDMPNQKPDGTNDPGSIFFRDTPPPGKSGPGGPRAMPANPDAALGTSVEVDEGVPGRMRDGPGTAGLPPSAVPLTSGPARQPSPTGFAGVAQSLGGEASGGRRGIARGARRGPQVASADLPDGVLDPDGTLVDETGR
jgi:hypothetical protein